MAARPSGTVTFLFTDIEGSSALWEADELTMRHAVARHDKLLAGAIDRHGGVVFSSMGDGVAAAFYRVRDAVAAAVDAQRLLTDEAWPGGCRLRVRMGLHTGEAEERDGNYFGPSVNRAARLMAAAHGGQIVVSDVTAGLLPTGAVVKMHDLGFHRLVGIGEPMRLLGVEAEGLVWLDQPLRSMSVAGNLPVALTRFVGRTAEVFSLSGELRTRRLITLTGTAGVGKTRLAVEAARSYSGSFPNGAWIVELASVVEPDAVVHVVAAVLGVPVQSVAQPVDALVDSLQGRRLLLVVDNCEHLRQAVAALVTQLVAAVPGVHVLATSREPLAISGEWVWPVNPLDTSTDSIELFCDRAVAAGACLPAGADVRTVVATMCAQLEGVPLAIELAAARSRTMSLVELSHRLDDRLRVLRKRWPEANERHQTLEAAINWSYLLLTTREQVLFDRLSVFVGGFDRTAAEAVCGVLPLVSDEVEDLLGSLVDRSMVVADRSGPVTRYRLLESLRQFGKSRLERRGERETLLDRHLDHYVGVAQQADRRWRLPGDGHVGDTLTVEWDNLRAAHTWATNGERASQAIALIEAITPWAGSTGTHAEVADWMDRVLTVAEHHAQLSPRLLGMAAWWGRLVGDDERSVGLANAGLQLAPDTYGPETAWCWGSRVWSSAFSGRTETLGYDAVAQLQALDAGGDPFELVVWGVYTLVVVEETIVEERLGQFRSLATNLANPIADAAIAFGSVVERWRRGDLDGALELTDAAIAAARRATHGVLVYNTGLLRLMISIERGHEDPRVLRSIRQLLDRGRYIPNPWNHRWWLIDALAAYEAVLGAVEPAALLMGAFAANHQSATVFFARVHATTMRLVHADPDAAHWLEQGGRLTPQQALTYAEELLESGLGAPA
jgi:predicted ATPase/class 3 adenylate cyclase